LTQGLYEFPPIHIDLGFIECARALDAIFVGGMGCSQLVPPHPQRLRPSIHNIWFNLSKVRTPLKDRLEESLRAASKEVLIAGWIGCAIIPQLKKCVELGVRLRIITKTPQEASGKGASDKSEAFRELPKFLSSDDVRLLPSCHARIIVIDERIAFVGSMDLDSESLSERDEAAIISEDADVVGKTHQFFEELFSKGTKPKWQK
jgi:phosphatidylserine/phosphatidylglycerophosphate/cardiolipin synthase-like enzyme